MYRLKLMILAMLVMPWISLIAVRALEVVGERMLSAASGLKVRTH